MLKFVVTFYGLDSATATVGFIMKPFHHIWMEGPGIEFLWGSTYSAHVQTGPKAHPASCAMGTVLFPWIKRPGHGVDHQPHLATQLKKG